MSLHDYLAADPECGDLVAGAVLAVSPLLDDPDPAPVRAVVEAWSWDLAGRMPLPWNFHTALDQVNHFLFAEQGLQGDRDTYDDPANALLPKVLERRRGLPITLAILWIEVTRRLGFQSLGIALPGHFITGLRTDLGVLYFDPFNAGRALGEEGAARLVAHVTGGRALFHPAMLEPVSNRAILTRLVRNLHVRYWRQRRWEEALWTSTHLVLLCPGESLPLRDRALVHFQRGEMESGLRDLGEAMRLGHEVDAELRPWLDKLQKD
jgi:regulator of sirC expression with transglutaminase-like and TPR domain